VPSDYVIYATLLRCKNYFVGIKIYGGILSKSFIKLQNALKIQADNRKLSKSNLVTFNTFANLMKLRDFQRKFSGIFIISPSVQGIQYISASRRLRDSYVIWYIYLLWLMYSVSSP
jgi:hypothetical protein